MSPPTTEAISEEDLRIYRRPVLIMGGGTVICTDGSVWVFTQNAGVWDWSEDPPIPGSRRHAEEEALEALDPRHFSKLEEKARVELLAYGIESPTQSQIKARASELEEGATALFSGDRAHEEEASP